MAVSASATGAADPGWAKYRGRHLGFQLSFFHPADWKARFSGFTWPPYGSPQRLIVALSTERLHNPNCHDVPRPDGTSTTACDPILESLPPGGVYITWWENLGILQPDPTGVPGNPTRVGGVFAKIVVDPTGAAPPAACPKNTSGSVQVYIPGTRMTPRPPRRPEISMYGCADTGDFPGFVSEVLRMIRTVSFRR
jgi:hypothetical protein